MNDTQSILNRQQLIQGQYLGSKLNELIRGGYGHTYRSYLSSSRWAGSEEYLFDLSMKHNLAIIIDKVDKRLLRQTVYYTVTGRKADVQGFIRELIADVDRFNEDRGCRD